MNNKALQQSVNGSKYNKMDREQAVMLYVMFGSINKVSEISNIPAPTLYAWVKTQWWQDITIKVETEKKQELNSNLTRIIDKSLQNIEKSLEFNDIKPKDAATIMGICFDKRQILNMKPTNITTSFKINDLAQQFKDYIAGKTIEGETTKD